MPWSISYTDLVIHIHIIHKYFYQQIFPSEFVHHPKPAIRYNIQVKETGFHFMTISTASKDLQDPDPNIYTLLLISGFFSRNTQTFYLQRCLVCRRETKFAMTVRFYSFLSYLTCNPHYALCYCYTLLVFPNFPNPGMRDLGQDNCDPEQQLYQSIYFCTKRR